MKRHMKGSRKNAPSLARRWAIVAVIAVGAALAFISLLKTPAVSSVRAVALVHGESYSQTGDAVHFVDGPAPTRATTAVVLTDTNCTPDGQGVSHCYNTMKLPDGKVITVRHDHNMHMVPCLAPGESIRLVPQT